MPLNAQTGHIQAEQHQNGYLSSLQKQLYVILHKVSERFYIDVWSLRKIYQTHGVKLCTGVDYKLKTTSQYVYLVFFNVLNLYILISVTKSLYTWKNRWVASDVCSLVNMCCFMVLWDLMKARKTFCCLYLHCLKTSHIHITLYKFISYNENVNPAQYFVLHLVLSLSYFRTQPLISRLAKRTWYIFILVILFFIMHYLRNPPLVNDKFHKSRGYPLY